MELIGLHAFVEVADARSVRRAAERLGYSQSAVSRHVTSFERAVGGPVFEREHGGMYLTAHGERLYPLAVTIVTALKLMCANPAVDPPRHAQPKRTHAPSPPQRP